MRVTNAITLVCSLLLPVDTVNCVQALKDLAIVDLYLTFWVDNGFQLGSSMLVLLVTVAIICPLMLGVIAVCMLIFVRCPSLSISQPSLATNCGLHADPCTVPVFRQYISLGFTPLLCLKRCHACDQWHSSRVFTLTGRHRKFGSNAEGFADRRHRPGKPLTVNSVTPPP
jgi:hypothetical protein